MPTYANVGGVYTFQANEASKTYVELSGKLSEGQIVVESTAASNQSVTFFLNGLDLTCSSDSAFYYSSSDSKMIVNCLEGTDNKIAYSGSGKKACLESENNLEVAGAGSLALSSGGHGLKADKITLSGSGDISLEKATLGDGFHGHALDAVDFRGNLDLGTMGGQAFDINDVDDVALTYDGSIAFPSASATEILVASCVNVFSVDNSFEIPSLLSLTATTVSGNIIENLNSSAIQLTVSGSFSANGAAVATQSVSPNAN